MGTQALTRLRAWNIRARSTQRSRTTGNLLMGSSVIVVTFVGGVVVDQARAGLAHLAVDDHGAGAADFLEAIGVPDDGGGPLAVGGDRVGGDPLQAGDDVGAGSTGTLKDSQRSGLPGPSQRLIGRSPSAGLGTLSVLLAHLASSWDCGGSWCIPLMWCAFRDRRYGRPRRASSLGVGLGLAVGAFAGLDEGSADGDELDVGLAGGRVERATVVLAKFGVVAVG
jgi:hypothetical protein